MGSLEPRREQYTVGWVCALHTEAAAAQAMLDEIYPALPSKNDRDSNVYIFGRMCNHNVVVATLPDGIYGTTSAALTAKEMLFSFPNIRFGLLVGIGGGIPSEAHDIRLGDIVVSKPDGATGGVLQFDLGRETNAGFERTGSLNRPPSVLLKALAVLRSRHSLRGLRDVSKNISESFEKFPIYKAEAKHPGPEQDRLFEADYDHPNARSFTCQRCDVNQLIDRDPRGTQDPVIHYGLIGSGNRVIKNSRVRDLLGEQNILCIEMEAAGLMDEFPCLVIRGICDYCDSHKNKRWQPYAALVAAAYAKELLSTIPVLEVEATLVALDILGEIDEIKKDLREIARQNEESRQSEHDDRIQSWLFPADPYINLKRALNTRHPGSGAWFLQDEQYLQWKSSLKSSLWLHGLAGCGKTVLVSSIVENLQQAIGPNRLASSSPILLYFFFDFRDKRKQSLEDMARTLAHQLYYQDINIRQPLDKLLHACGDGYRKPSTELLLRVVLDFLLITGRRVYLVFDALDECPVPRYDLLDWIRMIARLTDQRIHLLVTSRKEPDIDSVLGRDNVIDQVIAAQSDIIDADIRAYITDTLRTNVAFKRWDGYENVQQMIRDSLFEKSDGMFRWTACQLDVLSKCTNLRTLKIALNTLPSTLDETYSRVLRSIPDEQRDDVIRLLQLLVYSDEPLNLEEAVDAIAVSCTAKPYFDPEYRTPIHSEIIISCASLVMIERISEAPGSHVHREVLQITHFSVQQYLKSENVDPGWKDGLLEEHAMASNAKLCLAYCFELCRFGNDYDGLDGVDDDDKYLEDMPFTNTAARQWTQYAMQAKTHDNELDAMIQDFLTSDELEGARFNWLRLKDSEEHLVPDRKWSSEWFRESPEKLVPLTIASACGLYHSVKSLLLCGTDPNEFCPIWGSALYAASWGGHYDIVGLLLEHGARPNMRSGQVELSVTISSPNSTQRSEILHTLLQYDADVNACDEVVGVPLVLAAARGDEEIVNTLLAKGAEVNAVDNQRRSAILVAALNGHNTIVRKLLEHKANINSSVGPNGNALISACMWGHKEVVRTLLENGAVVCQQFDDVKSSRNALEAACWGGDQEIFQTLIEHATHVEHFNKGTSLNECLRTACDRGHDELVKLLIEYNADVNAQDCRYGNPLVVASESGHAQVVQLLVNYGANVNQTWEDTSTEPSFWVSPLHQACLWGHKEVTKILLDHHADINAQCGRYNTALMAACYYQSEEFVEMLLAHGANINQVGERYGTALIMACVGPRESMVNTLLAHGADFDQAEGYSKNFADSFVRRTPLLHIIEVASPFSDRLSANQATWLRIIKTLIVAGVDVNKPDDEGQTPLHYAAVSRSSELTEILIKAGALVDSVDESGQTSLIKAAEIKAKGRAEVLLKAGAKTDIQDIDGKTALHHAAEHGWLELCTMLVEAGASHNVLDSQGLTPLQLAEQEDQFEVVTLLSSAAEKSMG